MDPSIMQLLEQDEDENMHSGADVDAFTAALNRDIEGDASTSQPSDSNLSVLSQGSNYTSNPFLPQWNPSTPMENSISTSQQDAMVIQQKQTEPTSSKSDLHQQREAIEDQKTQDEPSHQMHPFAPKEKPFQDVSHQPESCENVPRLSQATAMHESGNIPVHNPGPDRTLSADYGSQLMKLQNMNSQPDTMSRMSNQQTSAAAAGMSVKQPILPAANSRQAVTIANSNAMASGALRGKQVSFGVLLPVIMPLLDKDKAMQLETLYEKLRKNEISKDVFVRLMKSIVGDQMLKIAVFKLQSRATQNVQNVPQLSGNINTNKPCDMERVPGTQAPSTVYGSSTSNYQSFTGANASSSGASMGLHDSQTRQVPAYQNMGATNPLEMTTQGLNLANMPKFDRQNSFGDPKRLQSSSPTHLTNSSAVPHNPVQWLPSSSKEQKSGTLSSMTYVKQEQIDQPNEQHRPQTSASHGSGVMPHPSSVQAAHRNPIPGSFKDDPTDMQSSRMGASALISITKPSSISSQTDTSNLLNSRVTPAAPPAALGNNAKALSRKPSVGQKKPQEVLGSSPPPSSKKQKVSGAFLDQSIEQLNDVTAVSGVDLREEEEQLFSGPKEDSRATEASRRVVQEEEERSLLEKVPFQRKLAEIMAKSGLKGISNDVERCLSLCLEERIRGLIGNLIRLSKQRSDIEKPRHRTIVTSDVRQQIMLMNKKAREEWEKKQAEAEKLQKLNEPEGNTGLDSEKDKDEARARSAKVNKEEDDKMRTTAANVAARAAVGGDDPLSKWQLMAEQARQKREGDAASSAHPGRDIDRKLSSSTSLKDNQPAEKKGQPAATSSLGGGRKVGRNQAMLPQPKVACSISVKDVIAVLEREPQMSRATLIYRLYEKIRSEAAVD